MPVSSANPINTYTGNGASTVFPYTFKILASADIEVRVGGVLKVLTTDYTLSGAGADGGGNVTFVSAPANGSAIVISSAASYDRALTDYQTNGDLKADTLDNDIDRVVILVKQLKAITDRAPLLAIGSALAGILTLTPEANKFLRWASDALSLTNVDIATLTPSSIAVTSYLQTLLDDADVNTALGTLFVPALGQGGCYLQYTNATTLTLARDRGSLVPVKTSGTWKMRQLGSSGVTLGLGGLAATTAYWIYLYDSAGALTLEASTTAPAACTDVGAEGIKVKTGDATRTLVGMGLTNGSTQWQDDATRIGVLSWYNRRRKSATNVFSAARTTASVSPVEVNSEIRTTFLAWADDKPRARINGGTFNSGANNGYTYVGIDGVSQTDSGGNQFGTNTSPVIAELQQSASEASHYATLCGFVTAGTQTWTGGASAGGQRTSLAVEVWG